LALAVLFSGIIRFFILFSRRHHYRTMVSGALISAPRPSLAVLQKSKVRYGFRPEFSGFVTAVEIQS
jgi:hypothetical protein